MKKKKKVVITGPFPTPEEVMETLRKSLGISKRKAKKIFNETLKIIDNLHAYKNKPPKR